MNTINYEAGPGGIPVSKKRFDKLTILEAVKEMEQGASRGKICRRLGASRSTVCEWMRDYASPGYHASRETPLTKTQKMSIVRDIEEGRMTIEEAKIAYYVPAISLIKQWMRQSKSREDGLPIPVKPVEESAPGTGKELPLSEREYFQKALEEAELRIKALNTLIDVAEEHFKIPIRKKAGARQS